MADVSKPLTRELNDELHQTSGQRAIKYLDTATAYDLWSEVYDTDGNFLQALDSIEMATLLPRAVSLAVSSSGDNPNPNIRVVDLGCGTGRNTLRSLDYPEIFNVVAIDLSPKMLEIARQRCNDKIASSKQTSSTQPTLTFETYDMIATPTPPPSATTPPADLIISTLVLEHVPVPTFFSAVSKILAPGGILLMTNMHAEMGNISQAGFVDPRTGDKIRPTSYAHTVEEVVVEAERQGFEIVSDANGVGVKEVRMRADLLEKLGVRSEKWIGIDVWFGGLWRKKDVL